MSSETMSLKGKIRNYAKKNNIAAQVVLQNYMFERFLERLSMSEYKDKFVVKGGMLIAAIVGLDTRSTMDLDATLRNIPLAEEQIALAIHSICTTYIDDGVTFGLKSINPIRKGDIYGGYCVRLDSVYDTIVTPLSIDISTGDIITPAAVRYEFGGIFDEKVKIILWGYNIETVMAEKIETILRRSIFSTRPRDFYDIYILSTTQKYDRTVLKEALEATAVHRGTLEIILNYEKTLEQIESSEDLKIMWNKYRRKFEYAKNITYQDIMNVLKSIMND